MKTKTLVNVSAIIVATLCMLILSFSNPAYGIIKGQEVKEEDGAQYVSGELLVKFKDGVEPEPILEEAALDTTGIERVYSIKPPVARFIPLYKGTFLFALTSCVT